MKKKIFLIACLALVSITNCFIYSSITEKPIVIITTGRNFLSFYEKNLQSTLNQQYTNYSIMFIDDASNDGTPQAVQQYLQTYDTHKRVQFITNTQSKKALHNLYDAIHSCPDDAIIVIVDADDQLAHPNVLATINAVYADAHVWMTYGNYTNLSGARRHFSKPIPETVINTNTFRQHPWSSSHLRTYYAWLFKKINIKDLQYEDAFFSVCTDFATMLPMLEMAGTHSRFIDEILYFYTDTSPDNNFRVQQKAAALYKKYILAQPPYQPLDHVGLDVDIQKNCPTTHHTKRDNTSWTRLARNLAQSHHCQ